MGNPVPAALKRALILFCLGSAGMAGVWAHPGIDEQLAELTRRIEHDPQRAELYLQRGNVHRLHADWPAAEADYARARALAPRMTEIDFLVGQLLLDADRATEARQVLERFLAAQPDHVIARVTLARAQARQGLHLAAAANYTRAIDAAGDTHAGPDLYLERARCLAAAGDSRLAEAVRGLDDGLERLGYPVTLELLAIELDQRRGENDDALRRVDRIASRSTRQETWLLRRAEILESAGRSREAFENYSRALAAVEALRPGQRNSRATRALERSARDGIARLETRASGG